ncbi:hypothetical protein ES703_115031 [subsurface metagenome]
MNKVVGKLSRFGFEMTPAPAVQAYFYIERLDYGEWVDFLIDTGASGTCLHGPHAFDLQEHMRPETLDYSTGIGGIRVGYYSETAVILLRDDMGQPLFQTVQLAIHQFTEECVNNQDILEDCLECPSILGRDILNNCLFT